MKEFPREHNRSAELDRLAKQGHFAEKDLPATDTYDDGLNHEGKLVMPGSTSVEAGGTYMEDQGPQDGVRREEKKETWADKPGMGVVSDKKLKNDIYAGEDTAAKWLHENDPNYKKAA